MPEAIDLSSLGLDQIEEKEDCFKIGAMVTLRELELHEQLNKATGNVLHDALKDIVGVQLRNFGNDWRKCFFSLWLFRCPLCFDVS